MSNKQAPGLYSITTVAGFDVQSALTSLQNPYSSLIPLDMPKLILNDDQQKVWETGDYHDYGNMKAWYENGVYRIDHGRGGKAKRSIDTVPPVHLTSFTFQALVKFDKPIHLYRQALTQRLTIGCAKDEGDDFSSQIQNLELIVASDRFVAGISTFNSGDSLGEGKNNYWLPYPIYDPFLLGFVAQPFSKRWTVFINLINVAQVVRTSPFEFHGGKLELLVRDVHVTLAQTRVWIP